MTRRIAQVLIATGLLGMLVVGLVRAQNLYVLEGLFRQETNYEYAVTATPGDLYYVSIAVPLPGDGVSLGHSQRVIDHEVVADPVADNGWDTTDASGTVWRTTEWYYVAESAVLTRRVQCVEETLYGPIVTASAYPFSSRGLPSSVSRWLEADGYSQSSAPEIVELADELTRGAQTEIEAVGRILGWVHAQIEYSCSRTVCVPVFEVDALFTLENRIGNCVNFANLAIALLRAAGLPAMPVTGFVADRAESHAAHAWIAVYFPDLDWVEFETANWMPAYGEVPVTFLLPQHITLHRGEGQGVCNASFTELHAAEFAITERPIEVTEVAAQIGAGQAVSWVVTLESAYDEITRFTLQVDGVPTGWHVGLSESEVSINPEGVADTRDILLTVCPPADAQTGAEATIALRATTEAGDDVGTVTAAVRVRGE